LLSFRAGSCFGVSTRFFLEGLAAHVHATEPNELKRIRFNRRAVFTLAEVIPGFLQSLHVSPGVFPEGGDQPVNAPERIISRAGSLSQRYDKSVDCEGGLFRQIWRFLEWTGLCRTGELSNDDNWIFITPARRLCAPSRPSARTARVLWQPTQRMMAERDQRSPIGARKVVAQHASAVR